MNYMLLTLALLLSLLISSCASNTKPQQSEDINQAIEIPINYSLFSNIENEQLNTEDVFF